MLVGRLLVLPAQTPLYTLPATESLALARSVKVSKRRNSKSSSIPVLCLQVLSL